jgi:hypothetical protein
MEESRRFVVEMAADEEWDAAELSGWEDVVFEIEDLDPPDAADRCE